MECRSCNSGCVTCTSATDCDVCVTEATRQGAEGDCACLSGYYDAGEIVCPKCSAECEECVDEATKCTKCDEDAKFKLVGTTCQCEDGYLIVVGATETTCELCGSNC